LIQQGRSQAAQLKHSN